MSNKQQVIENRILALSKIVAARLQENPAAIINKAKDNIARWSNNNGTKTFHTEWLTILDGELESIIYILVSEDENSKRLRSSSPFAGVIDPKERWKIIREIIS